MVILGGLGSDLVSFIKIISLTLMWGGNKEIRESTKEYKAENKTCRKVTRSKGL